MPTTVIPPPLTGRDDELTELRRLAGVADEGARVVLVSGDAGIGKTRLLDALAVAAVQQGRTPLIGHALDLGGARCPTCP